MPKPTPDRQHAAPGLADYLTWRARHAEGATVAEIAATHGVEPALVTWVCLGVASGRQ